jgi:hypothetical protein
VNDSNYFRTALLRFFLIWPSAPNFERRPRITGIARLVTLVTSMRSNAVRLCALLGSRLALLLILAASESCAAELTIMALRPDGRPEAGCRVQSFHEIDTVAKSTDYGSRFSGLYASGIPDGRYEAKIACDRDSLTKSINLEDSSQFELMTFSDRFMRSDPVAPQLVVKLADASAAKEIWWLRLTALYSDGSYVGRFDADTGEARVVDPEPGVYLVSIHSMSGYGCFNEVQFVEFTRRWVFHSLDCSFELDRYANRIQRDAFHKPIPSRWAEEMQRYKQEFLRALEKAADKP